MVIAKAGRPVVKLVRIAKHGARRVLGSAKGDARLVLKEGWDQPLTDKEMAEWFGL